MISCKPKTENSPMQCPRSTNHCESSTKISWICKRLLRINVLSSIVSRLRSGTEYPIWSTNVRSPGHVLKIIKMQSNMPLSLFNTRCHTLLWIKCIKIGKVLNQSLTAQAVAKWWALLLQIREIKMAWETKIKSNRLWPRKLLSNNRNRRINRRSNRKSHKMWSRDILTVKSDLILQSHLITIVLNQTR